VEATAQAPARPEAARVRLVAASPPPPGWQPSGWPAGPVRRCGCGAPIVSRCSRFTSCQRGCVHLAPAPPRPVPPRPRPPAAERAAFRRLIAPLRILERDLVRDQRQGRPASAGAVELALKAVGLLLDTCPGHGEEIAALLPWLVRRAARERAA
jgi:hypothetical protein